MPKRKGSDSNGMAPVFKILSSDMLLPMKICFVVVDLLRSTDESQCTRVSLHNILFYCLPLIYYSILLGHRERERAEERQQVLFCGTSSVPRLTSINDRLCMLCGTPWNVARGHK